VRLLTSAEVRAFVARHPTGDDRAALADWIEQAARMTADGLGDYRPATGWDPGTGWDPSTGWDPATG
jgi:hypothetical protein